VTLIDGAGLFGVAVIVAAYLGASLGRLDPQRAWTLLANLVGASLILLSLLTERFNLSASLMEGAWVVVALIGLARLGVRRLRGARAR
jgi:hypothetical protein